MADDTTTIVNQTLRQAREHFAAGRVADAAAVISRTIETSAPQSATLHIALAEALLQLAQPQEAVAAARRATQLQPSEKLAWQVLGIALVRADQPAEAQRQMERLVDLAPNDPEAHHQLGDVAALAGDPRAAVVSLRRAVELKPDYAAAWGRLGGVLRQMNDFTGAIDAFTRAADIDPNSDNLSNLGDAYITAARADEAIAPLERALAAAPSHLIARVNLGCARMRQARVDDAIDVFETVLRRQPDLPLAHFYLALALLKRGEYERGWREYEWRFAVPPSSLVSRIHHSFPAWRGEPLEGKRVLLYTEQGFGDTIQMARHVPLVAARRPARLIVACRPAMRRLFESFAGIDEIVTDLSASMPRFDLQCPFMSLPLALGTTLATIPSQVPYLAPPRDSVETWRQKLSAYGGAKVGLAWTGSPTNTMNRYRSCPFDELSPILDVPGVTFFNLQIGPGIEQLYASPLAPHVIDLTSGLTDWAETAALVANLDLVISIDSGVAHLAGALGKPVWTMLSRAADWRYTLPPAERTPWYPTMSLFRQQSPGNWGEVAQRVAMELEQFRSS